MSRRAKHTAEFKAQVAREALKEKESLSELSAKFKIHPTMISKWKADALEGMVDTFSSKREKKDKNSEKEKSELYEKIGRLEVDNDYLKKKSIELGIYPPKKFG